MSSHRNQVNDRVVNHFHFSIHFNSAEAEVRAASVILGDLAEGATARTHNGEATARTHNGAAASSRDQSDNYKCPVCLESPPNIIRNCLLDCGHLYCEDCIKNMLAEDLPCSLCKKPFEEWHVVEL